MYTVITLLKNTFCKRFISRQLLENFKTFTLVRFQISNLEFSFLVYSLFESPKEEVDKRMVTLKFFIPYQLKYSEICLCPSLETRRLSILSRYEPE